MKRRELLLAGLPAAVVVVGVVLAITGGSSVQPPATGAATVVPADALAYVHVSSDPKRSAVKDALAVAPRLPTYPLLAADVLARVSALAAGGTPVDYARDIRPWLGREVAFALLNTTGSRAGSELVLDVSRPAAAHAFVARAGAVPDTTYRGVGLFRYRTGAELAFLGHYLVLGQNMSVRAAIDAASGVVPSLAGSGVYQRAATGEPADRVADAYVSADGVRRFLIPQGGALGALGTMLDTPALTGAAISLAAAGTRAKVTVHTALLRSGAGRAFSPSLDRLLPAGTVLAFDTTGLTSVAPRVLSAAAALGIAGRIGPLLQRLGGALAAEGVDIGRLDALFAAQTAVALEPGGTLVIVTRVKDAQATSAELANLEVPLAQLFPAPSSGSGQVPQFLDRSVDGVTAHQLSLTTGLALNYTISRGLLVISTSASGIGSVIRHARALADEPAYRSALGGTPSRVTSLLFLDFSQLLDLGERTGLLRGARYGALAPDIKRVRAVGVDSTSGEADSTAELTFEIK